MKYPLQLLCCIVSRKNLNKLQDFYNDSGIKDCFTLSAQGSADTELGNIFGFGILDASLLTACVDTQKAKTMLSLFEALQHILSENIIMFSIPIDAISSNLLNLIGIELGGKNGGKK